MPTPKPRITRQNYPRILDAGSKLNDFLDESCLKGHSRKLSRSAVTAVIESAIEFAGTKASRSLLEIPGDLTSADRDKLLKRKGKELFNYFIKYCSDPASTALNCNNKHYKEVAKEQFLNQTLQKQRMNSGWRYQFIAKGLASKTGRFDTVSDLGTQEADFNAVVEITGKQQSLSMYVSVKNRVNTMGGQDWPKAIEAIERMAALDKNRTGSYICIFGIAMDRGTRMIKRRAGTQNPHAHNTEVWKSDFFWPFFTNLSYEEIIKSVLEVLMKSGKSDIPLIELPSKLLDSFGQCCRENNLINGDGRFVDAYKLAEVFCGRKAKKK